MRLPVCQLPRAGGAEQAQPAPALCSAQEAPAPSTDGDPHLNLVKMHGHSFQ